MIDLYGVFLSKAEENLEAAEGDLNARRYNSCASRCYYACYQAAIFALSQAAIRPARGQWSHAFVQAQFVGQLVNRRKLYETELRTVLGDNLALRLLADYDAEEVSERQASRALRRAREFLAAIR